MCIKEVKTDNEKKSLIQEYKVEISNEEAKNGRMYFWLPNGKRYYIDGDTDEVYLAENQSKD